MPRKKPRSESHVLPPYDEILQPECRNALLKMPRAIVRITAHANALRHRGFSTASTARDHRVVMRYIAGSNGSVAMTPT